MKEIDGNKVPSGTALKTDLCVIGGGAAGISIAMRLLGRNARVLVVESGNHEYDQETQDLYEFESVGHPLRAQKGYISRNRYLGGSTNTWTGRCAPLQPGDFKKRDWVPNSGWPIAANDLEALYPDTARLLRLPDAAFFSNDSWRRFLVGAKDGFLDSGKLRPTAFLSGRENINMRLAYVPSLNTSTNAQILLNSNVTEIITDTQGLVVQEVSVKTLRGNSFVVRARIYVLACGGWENARLLLASTRVNSRGVGNNNDNVGRYYMEHPKILGSKVYLSSKAARSPIIFWKRRISKDGFVRLGIRLTEDVLREHRLPNCNFELLYPQTISDAIAQSDHFFDNLRLSKSMIHDLIKVAPYAFSLAEGFERRMLNLPLRFDHGTMCTHMEQVPHRESRLTLSEDTDKLGTPKLKVNLRISREDKENMIKFHQVLGELLPAEGFGRLESELPAVDEEWEGLTDSSHHIGTTRMYENEREGVVDKDCNVYGVENLYVAGSSVFPTGGHVNPTFMIVALSLRLADHLKERYAL